MFQKVVAECHLLPALNLMYEMQEWVVSKRMNARDEFKYSLTKEGELLKWDYVSPSYTDFNPETEKFVKFVTEYSDDLQIFHLYLFL